MRKKINYKNTKRFNKKSKRLNKKSKRFNKNSKRFNKNSKRFNKKSKRFNKKYKRFNGNLEIIGGGLFSSTINTSSLFSEITSKTSESSEYQIGYGKTKSSAINFDKDYTDSRANVTVTTSSRFGNTTPILFDKSISTSKSKEDTK